MRQLAFNRFRRPSRIEWIAILLALAAMGTYLFVLRGLDNRAEAYFRDLRTSDPATYLTQIRESRGFAAYLPEYADLTGSAEFRPQVPSFLIGRWTMRDGMLRLTPGQTPSVCSDPVTFEYGLFLNVESGGVALSAQYRISDDTVEMRTADGSVFPIQLVGYGAQLDHIEFTPPGRDALVFAYLCGR